MCVCVCVCVYKFLTETGNKRNGPICNKTRC